MPGGDWVKRIEAVGSALGRAPLWIAINACLALVLIILILLPYPWTPSANHQGNTHVEQYQSDCDKADARYREFVSEPYYSGKRDDGSQYDAEKARLADELVTWCDLAAQHFAAAGATSAAKSSWSTFWTALLGVILLALTFWETRRVTSATREVGQKQVQAYLSIKAENAWLMEAPVNDQAVWIGGKIIIKNHGSSPASAVACAITFFCNDIPVRNLHGVAQKLTIGETLAPDEDDYCSPSEMIGFDHQEIREMRTYGKSIFSIKVAVQYTDVFNNIREEESFFYLLNGNTAAGFVLRQGRTLTGKSVDVHWYRYDKKQHDESNRPISMRDLLS